MWQERWGSSTTTPRARPFDIDRYWVQAPRPEDPPKGRLHSGPGSLEEAVVIHPHVELGGCRVRPGVGGLQYGRVDHPSPGGQAERGS